MEHLFPKVFSPGRIGSLELKNRLVMAAILGFRLDDDMNPPENVIECFAARARGGVGLITVKQQLFSHTVDTLTENGDGRLRIKSDPYLDKYIEGYKRLTGAIRENGSKSALQLMVPVRQRRLASGSDEEQSTKHGPEHIYTDIVEMTKEEIDDCVDRYGKAVVVAAEAGFDAVEFRFCHAATLPAFLSPFTNKREDEYGGDAAGRARLICEIVACARKDVGPDYPLIVRLSGSEFLEGGNTIEDSVIQGELIVKAGATALHISAGAPPSLQWHLPSFLMEPATLLPLAWQFKQNSNINVPIITVGKINDLAIAEQALDDGKADFIALGRALLADPDYIRKAGLGDNDEIRPCIYCNYCHSSVGRGKTLTCTVNPELLREVEFSLKATTSPKKIMVVGGGLAGMEAARILGERGHSVTLFEMSGKLGGQWNIACQEVSKLKDFAPLAAYLERGVHNAGVQVRLNVEVTPDLVKDEQPDVVIVATGAVPAVPDVPGVSGENVVQANDVITGKSSCRDNVVVVGARYLGMEVADFLAAQGKMVSLVDQLPIGTDVTTTLYLPLMNMLVEKGVRMYPDSPLYEIREKGVYIKHNNDRLLFLPADTVVLAAGVNARKKLYEQLQGSVKELYAIGDCVDPVNAMKAIRDGAELARKI